MSRSIKIWSGTSWEDVGPALPSVNTQFIQLTNPASTGVTIRAAASQSANIFQVQNYAATPLFTIDASGNVLNAGNITLPNNNNTSTYRLNMAGGDTNHSIYSTGSGGNSMYFNEYGTFNWYNTQYSKNLLTLDASGNLNVNGGTITNNLTNGVYSSMGSQNTRYFRTLSIPAKTTSAGSTASVSIYLGRMQLGVTRVNFYVGGGYSEDSSEYTFSRPYNQAPIITSIVGTNFENSSAYHNGMTFHYVAVDSFQYDVFINFIYNSYMVLNATMNGIWADISGVNVNTMFSVPNGVSIPTLNSSNKILWLTATDGYTGGIALNQQSSFYTSGGTLSATDIGKIIDYNSASSGTLTVPASTFPIGAQLMFVQAGAGQLTVALATGTLYSYGNKTKTAGQWATATLYQRAADQWILSGNLG
jgi:hypothetical protein